MLKYETLKTKPRELLATTSLNQDEFEKLLKAFEAAYEEACPAGQTIGGESRQRRQGGGRKSRLESMADKLLFILVYEKTYPLQMCWGYSSG